MKLCVLAVPLLMLACDGGQPAPTSETKKSAPPTPVEAKTEAKAEVKPDAKLEAKPDEKAEPAAPDKPAPAAPLTITAGAPGPAYNAVEKKGIVRLDDGKFTPVAGADTGSFKRMKVGADGQVYAANYSQIGRIDNAGFTVVAGDGDARIPNSLSDYAVAGDGQIWGLSYNAIDHFDGKAWTSEAATVLALAAEDYPQAVTVDRAGKAWLASSQKLFVREGDAWKPVDLKPARARSPYYLSRLELAPDDSVYALGMDSVFHLVGAEPAKKLKLGGAGSYSEFSVSTAGDLALVDVDKVTATRPADGKLRVLRSGKSFNKGSIWAVGADDSGRVWIGSDFGLSIVNADGSKTEFASGAAPEIAGEIKGILVLGSGPATLPGAGPVRKGGLKGTIAHPDDKPVADAPIEVCPNPAFIYSKTPCADQPVRFTGKTDAQGAWSFPEVPLGEYGVAVKVGGKWMTTLGFAMNSAMKEGEVHDIGLIKLADKK
jgi:hypothetical protein